jgi:hypothetical protein
MPEKLELHCALIALSIYFTDPIRIWTNQFSFLSYDFTLEVLIYGPIVICITAPGRPLKKKTYFGLTN